MIASAQAKASGGSVAKPVPRRILMSADPVGGVWNHVLELARGLSGSGVEIDLATMGPPLTSEQRREVAQEGNVTLHESVFRLELNDDRRSGVRQSGDWLLSLEAKLSPDLVHLNGYVHAALPWQNPCLLVAHSCMASWWQAVRREELPAGFQPYRSLVAKGLAAADLVVAPTAAMLESIEKIYLPLPNARVIHNARSRIRFEPGKKREFILSVGRLGDDSKNIGALAKTAADLPWPVYVAGEQKPPEGGAYCFGGVKRLGFLAPEHLAPWYAAASVYVLPARYEPFGLTVLEAAQSGCALLLGDIESLRELWDGAAVFVPPDEAAALHFELHALCADHSRLANLAELALRRSHRFSAAHMTAGYLGAYRELTAR